MFRQLIYSVCLFSNPMRGVVLFRVIFCKQLSIFQNKMIKCYATLPLNFVESNSVPFIFYAYSPIFTNKAKMEHCLLSGHRTHTSK